MKKTTVALHMCEGEFECNHCIEPTIVYGESIEIKKKPNTTTDDSRSINICPECAIKLINDISKALIEINERNNSESIYLAQQAKSLISKNDV